METIDIYFGNRVIHLTEQIEPFYAKFESREHLKKLIDAFERGDYYELYICYEDLNELFKNFKIFFNFIEAAGGVVYNRYNDILLIKRYDSKWQFPKGKVEPNETFEEAAIREVQEECGIEGLTIIKELTSTYHTFKRGGKLFLKQTKWFSMKYEGNSQPTPLTEEGIIEANWFSRDKVIELLKNSYKNLQVLLNYI